MARDERDPQDVEPERAARRDRSTTDRLRSGTPTGDTYNPRWRADRANGRGRAYQSVPSSRQEFAIWLQYGGWRFLLATIVIVIVAAVLILMSQPPGTLPSAAEEPTAPTVREPVLLATALPTVTPTQPISPTAVVAAQQQGATFRVEGTEGLGLFLRAEADPNGQILKTLPEGSEVTIIGEDMVKPDRVWKHVRDAAGSEGWAASDFLKPVSP